MREGDLHDKWQGGHPLGLQVFAGRQFQCKRTEGAGSRGTKAHLPIAIRNTRARGRGEIAPAPRFAGSLSTSGFTPARGISSALIFRLRLRTRRAFCFTVAGQGHGPPSRSTEKSWPHFRPSAVDFCGSRLAIGAATERARALAMPAVTRAQALTNATLAAAGLLHRRSPTAPCSKGLEAASRLI